MVDRIKHDAATKDGCEDVVLSEDPTADEITEDYEESDLDEGIEDTDEDMTDGETDIESLYPSDFEPLYPDNFYRDPQTNRLTLRRDL